MNRNAIFSAIVIVVLILVIAALWFIYPEGIESGIGGIAGGILGGVLLTTYLNKYRDERFVQLMNQSARNMAIFLLFALPWFATIMLLGQLTIFQSAGIVFLMWFAGIGLIWASLIYYYRK